METFNSMSALPPGAVTSTTDDAINSINAGQPPLGMESFDQEMPFDEYSL